MISVSEMSLERKVGMLLMAPLYADCLEDLVGRFGCGSLLTWGGAFGDTAPESIEEFCELTNRVQRMSMERRGLPVWLHGMPHQAISGREQGWLRTAAEIGVAPERVERAAKLLGTRWCALGVHNIPEPTLNVPLFETCILREGTTSSDPEQVRVYGTAFNRGMLAGGCGTMAQHFPAHGATPLDSHTGFPVVDLSLEELWHDHLLPYQQCFDDGCTTICTAHLTCTALDPDHIATTSKRVLTDFLRGEMHFKGIAIADAIEMDGFKKEGPLGNVVVEAVKAGCDSICMVSVANVEPIFNSLLVAVESETIPLARVDEAVQRQLDFMEWLGLGETWTVDAERAAQQIRELDKDPDAEVLTLTPSPSSPGT